MRNNLEHIQLIDKYLRGVLSKEDTIQFENKLKTDKTLQTEVEKQKLLMEAIKRNALKNSAKKGQKSYKLRKSLKTIGTVILIATIAGASYFILNKEKVNTEQPITEISQDPINTLPTTDFDLNTQKDTVIETENGLVLVIPSDAFETQNGEEVTGNIAFKIKEAFTDYDIMKAGLSTTSNGELLETGGMFFLTAFQNGKELKLKKGKEILSQIPNLHPEKEMLLFDGEKDSAGNINWVNPKPFEKDLLTVDITTLDFYPEGYLEELNTEKVLVKAVGDIKKGKMTIEEARTLGFKYPPRITSEEQAVKLGWIVRDYENKKRENHPKSFTDSLYYSFGRLFEKRDEIPKVESDSSLITDYEEEEILPLDYYDNIDNHNLNKISEILEHGIADSIAYDCPIPPGINPSKIKAIWNKKFNKTILATREFEQRIKVIHQTRKDRILKMYIRNIQKPLWYSDSVAATMSGGEFKNKFLAFYKEKKGGVKVNDKLASKLSAYFSKKQKDFTASSAKAFNEYKTNVLKIRNEYSGKKSAKQQEEYTRKEKVFQEEYKMNLCNAAQQIGKKGYCPNDKISAVRIASTNKPLTKTITSLGAKNIDQYVYAATRNRSSLNYTDPITGKKAVIKYEPMKVKVLNTEKFDKVFVYLIPDSLSSFNRMKSNDNVNFNLNLNELLNYKLVCLAYQGEKVFYTELPKVMAQNYEVTLSLSSEEKIKNSLDAKSKLIQKEIESDIEFQKVSIAYGKKQQKFKNEKELTIRIGCFLFPMVEKDCLWGSKINYDDFENSGH